MPTPQTNPNHRQDRQDRVLVGFGCWCDTLHPPSCFRVRPLKVRGRRRYEHNNSASHMGPIYSDPKIRNRRHGVDFLSAGGWHCVGSGSVVLALASAAFWSILIPDSWTAWPPQVRAEQQRAALPLRDGDGQGRHRRRVPFLLILQGIFLLSFRHYKGSSPFPFNTTSITRDLPPLQPHAPFRASACATHTLNPQTNPGSRYRRGTRTFKSSLLATAGGKRA